KENDFQRAVFLDGGLIANNPALNIFSNSKFTDALKNKRPIYILSLGTGERNPSTGYTAFWSLGKKDMAVAVEKFIGLILTGTSKNTNDILERLDEAFNSKDSDHRFWFRRINPNIPDDALDKAGKENLQSLSAAAETYLTNDKILDEFAEE